MTQKFYNKLLFFLAIICLIIILQIYFFQIPLNLFNFSLDIMEKINNILLNLSISIIAAYIFYIINVQIVNHFRERKTRALIHDYLSDIVNQINLGQEYLSKKHFQGKDFNHLTKNDFDKLITLQQTEIDGKYNEENTLGEMQIIHTGILSETDLFENERIVVMHNIQIIFSFPYISSIDYELVNLLHKIKSSYFYIGVRAIKEGQKYVDFERYFFEHYQNFKMLKKHIKPKKITFEDWIV